MMDFTTLNTTFGAVLPVAAGVGALGYFGLQDRWRKQDLAKRAAALHGRSILRHAVQELQRSKGEGTLSIAGAGGLYSRIIPDMLRTFKRAGVADFVASILLIEPDVAERSLCL